jgi:hypothetical protein
MAMRAFLSYSRNDVELVNSIYGDCKRVGIKLSLAELEAVGAGRFTAGAIADMIKGSRYFFMLLTENVMNDVNMMSWVNFELGYAYGIKMGEAAPPKEPMDIYVLEPYSQVMFPIPYLDYYILFKPERARLLISFLPLWARQSPSYRGGVMVRCERCKSKYRLLSKVGAYYCPTCRIAIVANSEKESRINVLPEI